MGAKPAAQRNLHLDATRCRQFNSRAIGFVLRAALDQHIRAPPAALNGKRAIAKEKWRARAALQHGVRRVGKVARGIEYVDFGVERFTGDCVDNRAVQSAHNASCQLSEYVSYGAAQGLPRLMCMRP